MKNFKRNEVLSWISDLYKDVHGVRPRYINFNEWSDGELEVYTDKLIVQLKENEELERLQEEADVKGFQDQIQKTIELGAGDRKTALKWLFSSEEYDQGEYVTDWDVDGFLYKKGIVHSDFGKEVKKELLEIYC
jgi:hypothetical protein